MYNTGNEVPSSALEDMADNAQTFDALVTKTEGTTTDRKGVNRRVFQQIIMDMGFQPLSGSFQTGATITARNQCLLYTSTGTFYSWNGALPKVVPAGSTPATSGGIGVGAWADRTDLMLSSSLASPTGDTLIGSGLSTQAVVNGNNFIKYGGIPDYTGAPLYDGNDASRITATDNSPRLTEMLTGGNCVSEDGTLFIHIPAGHFGFKTPITTLTPANTGAIKVVFKGEGLGISILDFIHEDSTHSSYVWYYAATVLLRLQGFDEVVFDGVTTKCTTKHGPVNGSTSPDQSDPSAYYGSVWFSSCEGNKKVTFNECEATRGNYYCNSVYGTRNDAAGHTGELYIINCKGHHNTSSGFAGQFLDKMVVVGEAGEYYRNGTRGISSVGYGVKAEFGVNNFLVKGGEFYENYRKGVDRHSGCGLMEVKGATFRDNVLYDIYDNNWYASTYYPNGTKNTTILNGNTHILNANPTWLADAMSAVKAGTLQRHFWAIFDHDNPAGVNALRNDYVLVKNATAKLMNTMSVKYNQLSLFITSALNAEYVGNKIDVYGVDSDNNGATADIYTKRFFINEYPSGANKLTDNDIKLPDGAVDGKNTFAFQLYGTGSLNLKNNVLDLLNILFKCSTISGDAIVWNGNLEASDNTILLRDLKLISFAGSSYTNATYYLAHPFMFTGNVTGKTLRNKIAFGDGRNIVNWDYSKVSGGEYTDCLPSSNKAIGDAYNFLIPNPVGNLVFDLKGYGAVYGDNLVVGYYFSGFTKTVHLASSYLTAANITDSIVQYNGANTNFTFKQVSIAYSSAQTGLNGLYKISISAQNGQYPVIADMG